MTVQYIEKDGRREYAIVPIDEYERLVAAAEMSDDILAYDAAKRNMREGVEEAIPSHIVNRLVAGENPIRVWREFRGLTQRQLAAHSGVAEAQLDQLESDVSEGRVSTLSRIAAALDLMVDDLISWQTAK